MTRTSTRAMTLATAITAVAAMYPAATSAKTSAILPAPGPWPAGVNGARNPLIGTPVLYNGAYATGTPSFRIWLSVRGRHRMSVKSPVGRHVVVRGRLRNAAARHSIGGAIVTIAAQNVYTGAWYAGGVVVTNRKGRFRARMPVTTHTRLAALYYPAVSWPAPVYSRRVLVQAASRVYMKATMLKHRRIVYRGKVSGAPIPAGGLLVAAQVRNGRHWATVRLTRTQPSGRFVARYTFKTRQRFRVRALVPAQPAWPFYSGRSLVKRVKARR